MDYYNTMANGPYYNPNIMQQPMYAQPQYMNTTPQVQQTPQFDNRFVYIQGKEAAKAYPVAPEKTVLFLDDQNPYIYRKTTDKLGRTTEFKVFRLEEEVEPIPEEHSIYATKDDLNNLSKSIEELKAMLIDKPRNGYKQNYQGKKGAYNG